MIDGNNVIWIDKRSGNEQVYLYDIATEKERAITSQKSFKLSPVINGDNVVWIDDRNGGSWDVYQYNLTTGKETPTCTNSARQAQPWIYGNTIAWADGRNKTGRSTPRLSNEDRESIVKSTLPTRGYPMVYGN